MAAEIRIHKDAAREYRHAWGWYLGQSASAAAHFDKAFERISGQTESGTIYAKRFRWLKLKKYPFLIYYRVVSDSLIRVYAVAHERRRPGYWMRRSFGR